MAGRSRGIGQNVCHQVCCVSRNRVLKRDHQRWPCCNADKAAALERSARSSAISSRDRRGRPQHRRTCHVTIGWRTDEGRMITHHPFEGRGRGNDPSTGKLITKLCGSRVSSATGEVTGSGLFQARSTVRFPQPSVPHERPGLHRRLPTQPPQWAGYTSEVAQAFSDAVPLEVAEPVREQQGRPQRICPADQRVLA